MYFATYIYEGVEKIGVLTKDKSGVVDINELKLQKKYNNMIEFIENCNDNTLRSIEKELECNMIKGAIPLSKIKLLSPIPYVKNDIICLGLNYKDHIEESKSVIKDDVNIPKAPIYFSKRAHKVTGPYEEIDGHLNITNELDYEVELAVIIGKEGTNIPIEKAKQYIFGYTILNDVSARDLQRENSQWMRGKSLDTFAVMGPYIIDKLEIPFPPCLNLYSKVNGNLRQSSNTKNFIFDIPYIISDISKGMTLKAGDIISTGTPSGVGMGYNPPKYLKKGDIVECYIEKIGKIINKVK